MRRAALETPHLIADLDRARCTLGSELPQAAIPFDRLRSYLPVRIRGCSPDPVTGLAVTMGPEELTVEVGDGVRSGEACAVELPTSPQHPPLRLEARVTDVRECWGMGLRLIRLHLGRPGVDVLRAVWEHAAGGSGPNVGQPGHEDSAPP